MFQRYQNFLHMLQRYSSEDERFQFETVAETIIDYYYT